jgi:hypothetical protein
VSSHFAGCEKPLFILELLGVEFGASPGCPVSKSLSRPNAIVELIDRRGGGL